ncbi:MBL fold metallo-hydrolase [Flavobacterium defluvii]|uniref:Glyoxylase, beta-lactamase superfamily II n=1 Tax=Flavobacterium defluvii TaxID=370979 RepID=A0A1M5UTU2_9FLAO|nr:MBL fold metallo-hydrolase [Flavobacterium defluvii]SHH66354.1 Glyoxylase, beta-lactamase superfamily II [Flavobacterium defluvii]
MKSKKIISGLTIIILLVLSNTIAYAQFPMPDHVPIWDANKVTLKLHKISENIYVVSPSTVETETTKGIAQATSAGFIVGEKGVLVIETLLSKRLYDQFFKLIRSVTNKPIVYAINTSDHGDHCFGNYLLPKETIIIQNEFCKENLSKNYENIKQFMIMLFGKERGIEESVYRPADITIAINQNMKIDMGRGNIVEVINVGTAQSPADLFVYLKSPAGNVLWAGNPFIAESPTIPWLFDGYFLEPVNNLNKIYNMIGDNDIVVPGHGRITNKAGIKYTIDYVEALKANVENAVKKGLTLEETKTEVKMKEFDKGYELFNWLHFNFNIPNAYKDIKQNSSK